MDIDFKILHTYSSPILPMKIPIHDYKKAHTYITSKSHVNIY